MTDLNSGNCELTINDLAIVSGGTKNKGHSGALDAANKIDLSSSWRNWTGPLPRPSRFKLPLSHQQEI